MAFAQQVWAYARSSPDVLIALSTSGNSSSVVNAVRTANALGRKSIGITGIEESSLSREATVCIRIPETETYKVQELTLPVYHTLCAMAEATFFLSGDIQ
ncbi:Phosphoheptose isomerase [bioreactor metagenome]|uniref:Phosphoheptose isomerase n=1 Tax=bioreactor metagenome TaxID=1076179 RepID=A0A645IDM8_9ZZZZ